MKGAMARGTTGLAMCMTFRGKACSRPGDWARLGEEQAQAVNQNRCLLLPGARLLTAKSLGKQLRHRHGGSRPALPVFLAV